MLTEQPRGGLRIAEKALGLKGDLMNHAGGNSTLARRAQKWPRDGTRQGKNQPLGTFLLPREKLAHQNWVETMTWKCGSCLVGNNKKIRAADSRGLEGQRTKDPVPHPHKKQDEKILLHSWLLLSHPSSAARSLSLSLCPSAPYLLQILNSSLSFPASMKLDG